MASLIGTARDRLKTVLAVEFAPDGFSVLDDKLTRAMGRDGNYIGISPVEERDGESAHTLEAEILVQIYGYYDPQINEYQQVDPATAEGWADRLRDSLRPEAFSGDNDCWYFRVKDVEYPDDPTGNKSRVEAKVVGYGPNNNLY